MNKEKMELHYNYYVLHYSHYYIIFIKDLNLFT